MTNHENVLFDVFLSHSSADKPAVEVIAQRLRSEAGIHPFLDSRHLVPGMPWQDELTDALAQSATLAVFIGPSGLGSWHHEETRVAVDRAARTRNEFRVIPVLLPSGDPTTLPGFLTQRTWVDFRAGLDDVSALTRLAAGIRGEAIEDDRFQLPDDPAPYRGLRRFEADDHWLFFGRDADVGRLVKTVMARRFAAVIGASGSGKSSLVRAGLIPRLSELGTRDGAAWRTVVCTPGADPMRSLAQQVAVLAQTDDVLRLVDELTERFGRRDDGLGTAVGAFVANAPGPVLVFVDQFEELLTVRATSPEKSRSVGDRFVANLAEAVADATGSIRVVITLRADFLGSALSVPGLKDLLQDHQVMLGALTGDELREAIVRPAQAVGALYEKGLVQSIIGDVDTEPGALPMLQHALHELWTARRGPWLTIDAYQRSGGVIGALPARAQATYDGLSPAQQHMAQMIFIRLTTLGDGVPDTRRRVPRDELYPAGVDRHEIDVVLDALGSEEARLIVLDGDSVEVSHEALLRRWDTLRRWLDLDREALRVHRRLSEAANQWAYELGRDRAALYRGARLIEATEWASSHSNDLNDVEAEFVERSAAVASDDLEAERRRSRSLRHRLTAAIIALVLATAGGVGAIWALDEANNSRARAEHLATAARAGELAALSAQAVQRDPEVAALLARESDRVASTGGLTSNPATLSAMQSVVASPWQRTLGTSELARGVSGMHAASAVFSPDGTRIVTVESDGTARVWGADGTAIATLTGHTDLVKSAVFSPDGTRILTTSDDRTARVWAADGTALATLAGHNGQVLSAVFSPDGTRIVTASDDGTARVWATDGTNFATLAGHNGQVLSAVFSPDGTRIVTASADQAARVWGADGTALATLTGHDDGVNSAMFSPDGTRILTASDDGTARVWAVDGTALATLAGHTGKRQSATFSPDGSRIVTVSGGTTRVWTADGNAVATLTDFDFDIPVDLAVFSPDATHIVTAGFGRVQVWTVDGSAVATLTGHTSLVWSAVFSPDGTRILTASVDQTARVWGVDGTALATLTGHAGPVESAVFSPDGTRIATASSDGTARVWAVDSTNVATLTGEDDIVNSAVFSPDGTRIATASSDGTARVWAVDGTPLATLTGHDDAVYSATFSPDGTRIATASDDRTARVWAVDGTPLATLTGHDDAVYSATFSPDGTRIATASDDHTARVWAVDGTPLATPTGHTDVVNSAVFSPDGTRIATASDDDTARVWAVDGTRLATLTGHTDVVNSAVFSPDGSRIVTASDDETARVWAVDGTLLDTLRQTAVATVNGQPAGVYSAVLSPDGSRIVTASSDGTARVWAVDGTPLATLTGHTDVVNSATFSPDGTHIVTASDDHTARVWAVDGTPLATLTGHTDVVYSATFGPDGTDIVTASVDGTARVWRHWPDNELRDELRRRLGARQFTPSECTQYQIDPCPSSAAGLSEDAPTGVGSHSEEPP